MTVSMESQPPSPTYCKRSRVPDMAKDAFRSGNAGGTGDKLLRWSMILSTVGAVLGTVAWIVFIVLIVI